MIVIYLRVSRMTALYSEVSGVGLRPAVVRLRYEANENEIRTQDGIIENRRKMIDRANETLKRNPKGDENSVRLHLNAQKKCHHLIFTVLFVCYFNRFN